MIPHKPASSATGVKATILCLLSALFIAPLIAQERGGDREKWRERKGPRSGDGNGRGQGDRSSFSSFSEEDRNKFREAMGKIYHDERVKEAREAARLAMAAYREAMGEAIASTNPSPKVREMLQAMDRGLTGGRPGGGHVGPGGGARRPFGGDELERWIDSRPGEERKKLREALAKIAEDPTLKELREKRRVADEQRRELNREMRQAMTTAMTKANPDLAELLKSLPSNGDGGERQRSRRRDRPSAESE